MSSRPAAPTADASDATPERRRRPALDGIRGCAVAGVLVVHLDVPTLAGDIGVGVFFVLSGYLITGLLLDEAGRHGRVSLRRFWVRRAARLLPVLAVLVVLNTVYAATTRLAWRAQETSGALPWVLGYVGNWRFALTTHDLGAYVHTWSLAVEEQFYALWPIAFVLWWVVSRRRESLMRLLACGAAASLLIRLADWPGYTRDRVFGTDYRADQLLIGCLLAVALHERAHLAAAIRHLTKVAALAAIGVLGALVVFVDAFPPTRTQAWLNAYYVVGFTVVALAAAAIIADVELRPSSRLATVLSASPLAGLGRISYGVYLLHIPVYFAVAERLPQPSGQRWVLQLVLSLAVARLSYVFVEQPCLALKDRWLQRSPARPATPATVPTPSVPRTAMVPVAEVVPIR